MILLHNLLFHSRNYFYYLLTIFASYASKNYAHMRRFGGFIVNSEHISHLCSSVSIVNFEQVNPGWGMFSLILITYLPILNSYKRIALNKFLTFCQKI